MGNQFNCCNRETQNNSVLSKLDFVSYWYGSSKVIRDSAFIYLAVKSTFIHIGLLSSVHVSHWEGGKEMSLPLKAQPGSCNISSHI